MKETVPFPCTRPAFLTEMGLVESSFQATLQYYLGSKEQFENTVFMSNENFMNVKG